MKCDVCGEPQHFKNGFYVACQYQDCQNLVTYINSDFKGMYNNRYFNHKYATNSLASFKKIKFVLGLDYLNKLKQDINIDSQYNVTLSNLYIKPNMQFFLLALLQVLHKIHIASGFKKHYIKNPSKSGFFNYMHLSKSVLTDLNKFRGDHITVTDTANCDLLIFIVDKTVYTSQQISDIHTVLDNRLSKGKAIWLVEDHPIAECFLFKKKNMVRDLIQLSGFKKIEFEDFNLSNQIKKFKKGQLSLIPSEESNQQLARTF